MWVFTKAADLFDKVRYDNERFIDSYLQPWVGSTLENNDPWYSPHNFVVYAGAGSLYAANKFTTEVAAGFFDVLRLGDGVAEGGWGYAKDGLRLLTVLGPVMKGVRFVGGLTRVLDVNPALDNCTWVAVTRALRLTGTRHFAVLGDLIKASGLATIAETGGAFVDDLLLPLTRLGGRLKLFAKEANAMGDIVKAAKENPSGVVAFSVKWTKQVASGPAQEVGHSLLASRSFMGGIKIIDRTGKVASSLLELEKMVPAYQGIGTAVPYGAYAVIQNSVIVHATGLLPLLVNRVAFEVVGIQTKPQPPKAAPVASGAISTTNTILPPLCLKNSDMINPVCGPPQTILTKTYVVQAGDSLFTIAKLAYGDGNQWKRIYEANKAVIGPNPHDPRAYKKGMKLIIP